MAKIVQPFKLLFALKSILSHWGGSSTQRSLNVARLIRSENPIFLRFRMLLLVVTLSCSARAALTLFVVQSSQTVQLAHDLLFSRKDSLIVASSDRLSLDYCRNVTLHRRRDFCQRINFCLRLLPLSVELLCCNVLRLALPHHLNRLVRARASKRVSEWVVAAKILRFSQ